MGSEKRLSFSPFQKRSRVRAFSGGEIIREWGLIQLFTLWTNPLILTSYFILWIVIKNKNILPPRQNLFLKVPKEQNILHSEKNMQ